MVLNNAEPQIATLLDLCASREVGIIAYAPGEWTKPAHLSYSELRALATQKADFLSRYDGIFPRKIVLIHFKSHIKNIIWFWASVLAGCVPTLSTPLVNNTEGRISHFKHLHRLLLDPVVITREEFVNSDFAENDILQVVAVEALESLKYSGSRSLAESEAIHSATDKAPKGHHHGSTNVSKDGISDCDTDCITSGLSNGLIHRRIGEHDHVSKNGSVGGHTNDDMNSNKNGAICSIEGIAALMLTSGSTGNAKAVCLTHEQILAAIRGKLFNMPLPHGSTLLNWIALDHVASPIEIHLCAMFARLDQVHVPSVGMLSNPLRFFTSPI